MRWNTQYTCLLLAGLLTGCFGPNLDTAENPGISHPPNRFEVPDNLVVSVAYVRDATIVFVQERSLSPEVTSGDFANARSMIHNGGKFEGNKFGSREDGWRAESAAIALSGTPDWCPTGARFYLEPMQPGQANAGFRFQNAYIGWKAGWAFLGRCRAGASKDDSKSLPKGKSATKT